MVVVGEGRRVLVAVVVLGRVPVLLLVLLLVVVVVSAVAGEQVAAVVVAAADVVPRSPFRLSIRLLVVLLVVEQEQEQGVVVVVVVVANSIPHFAGVVAIRFFAPPVMLPLLPRSDSELVLPHSVHPMHFVLLHPQVSEFLETVKCTSDC